jgi:energy-coupling factor transport system ATP-binding protein
MIDIENININYQVGDRTIPALSSFSLQIKRGEYVAILGPNGSGKSTLLKALCGLVRVDAGRIHILGKDVRLGGFGEDFFGKVGVVFQEPEGQFLMRDVKSEINSVLENLGLPIQIQREKLASIVERFDLAAILDQKPENLSGGQMQIVNLACAMAVEPQLLLLDEATTFLDGYYQRMLLNHLDALHQGGLTIINITQFPDEAAQAGRICVLDEGKLVSDCSSDKYFEIDDLLRKHKLLPPKRVRFQKLFGFDWNDSAAAKMFCEKLSVKKKSNEGINISRESVLSAQKLEFHYANSTFSLLVEKLNLAKGEIVGLIGGVGSGKSTLALLLAGLIEPDSGTVEYSGKLLSAYSLRELRKKIGITWQLPDLAMIGPTVKEDIEFNLEEKTDIADILNRVGLTGFEDRIVDTLSGGEKRKLSLAVILAANPEYIILDEPAAFLDPVSHQELIKIIKSLAQEGRGVMIAGHDLQFISELADRIVGIRNGKIIFDLTAPTLFSNQSYLGELELPADPIIGFRQMLAEHGYMLPFGSMEPEKIWEGLGITEG